MRDTTFLVPSEIPRDLCLFLTVCLTLHFLGITLLGNIDLFQYFSHSHRYLYSTVSMTALNSLIVEQQQRKTLD